MMGISLFCALMIKWKAQDAPHDASLIIIIVIVIIIVLLLLLLFFPSKV